ncbi:hemerythrin-like metal-binding domain-containing protein, partial [Helicobacter aurati]
MLLAWDDKYSVGNYLIDEQHKKLFELANMAGNMIGKQTDPAEIKKMLAALFEYMKTHFRDEETYM